MENLTLQPSSDELNAPISDESETDELFNGNLLIPNTGVSAFEDFSFEYVQEDSDSSSHMVLIVDDCCFNLSATASLFMQFNLKCDTCNNGQEAISLVKARQESDEPMYKLILMDYSMPECGGLRATQAIRSLINFAVSWGSDVKQPLICCLTAYNEKSYKDAAKKSGMDCLLVKPIFKASAHKILIKAGLI